MRSIFIVLIIIGVSVAQAQIVTENRGVIMPPREILFVSKSISRDSLMWFEPAPTLAKSRRVVHNFASIEDFDVTAKAMSAHKIIP